MLIIIPVFLWKAVLSPTYIYYRSLIVAIIIFAILVTLGIVLFMPGLIYAGTITVRIKSRRTMVSYVGKDTWHCSYVQHGCYA